MTVISKVLDSLKDDLVSAERFFRLIPYREMPMYKAPAARLKKYAGLFAIIIDVETAYIDKENSCLAAWQKLAETREIAREHDNARHRISRKAEKMNNIVPLKDVG